MSDISKLSEDDKKKLIAAGSHMGSSNVHQGMTEYILYQRSNGNFVINLNKTWEKILLAADKIVEIEELGVENNYAISYDPSGQKAILKFDYPTGECIYGNCSIEEFFSNPDHCNESHILVENYLKYDSSYNKEASMFKSTIIAFCNTDTPLENVDLVIPCNNQSIASVGLMWWLLKREVLRLQEKSTENAEWNIRKYSEEPQAECGESSNAIEYDYDETAPRYCSNNFSNNHEHVPANLENNFIANQFDEAESSGNIPSSNNISQYFSTFSALDDNNDLRRRSTSCSSEIEENLDNEPNTNQLNSAVTSSFTINSDYISGLNLNYPSIPDYSNYDTINSIVPPHFNYVQVYSQRSNLPRLLNPVRLPVRTHFIGDTQRYDLMQFPSLPQSSNIIQRFDFVQFTGGLINVLAQIPSPTRVSSVLYTRLPPTYCIRNTYGSSEIIQIQHTWNY